MEDQIQNHESPLFGLTIDEGAASVLKTAGTWAKVLGILGIVFGVLFLVFGFFYQAAVSNNLVTESSYSYGPALNRSVSNSLGIVVLIVSVIACALTVTGSIFALNFGRKITSAIQTNDTTSMASGFTSIRNYFAFWAILMIIYLVLVIFTVASSKM